jgi:hypothetical protein
VAKTGVYLCTDSFVHPVISEERFQQRRFQSPVLWKDEFDQLYHAIHPGSHCLLPIRPLSGTLLRLYAESADWFCLIPAASEIQQMVAEQAQTRAAGAHLA